MAKHVQHKAAKNKEVNRPRKVGRRENANFVNPPATNHQPPKRTTTAAATTAAANPTRHRYSPHCSTGRRTSTASR